MLPDDVLDQYLKAGKIAAEVRREAEKIVRVGTPILQICSTVENSIRRKGGELAFPCNVCINEIAAHYSSPPGDMKTIHKDTIVKVDLGVHVNGYIADTATTVCLNPQYDGMVHAVNSALEQAVGAIKPKSKTSEIGRIIEKTIKSYGFKPIRNLSGHKMERYLLHTGKSVPNVPTFGFESMEEGEVFAVEPFLTLASGRGEIKSIEDAYIFRFQRERQLNNNRAEELLKSVKTNFRTLPFSPRWIKDIEEKTTHDALNELISSRCISSYPVLVEDAGEIVTQAEHTVIVTRDGCTVTTN